MRNENERSLANFREFWHHPFIRITQARAPRDTANGRSGEMDRYCNDNENPPLRKNRGATRLPIPRRVNSEFRMEQNMDGLGDSRGIHCLSWMAVIPFRPPPRQNMLMIQEVSKKGGQFARSPSPPNSHSNNNNKDLAVAAQTHTAAFGLEP